MTAVGSPDGAQILGRRREQEVLGRVLASNRAEFVAIYGRRRVGKTFLIRRFFEIAGARRFCVTGKSGGKLREQLAIFQSCVETTFFGNQRMPTVDTWDQAFALLVAGLRQAVVADPSAKWLLFFDELPWLCTARSNLLGALDHTWNTELSQLPQVKLVVCGSAASWMLKKIIHAKGGLHNRITEVIRLSPFSLGETRELLESRGIHYAPGQVIDLYMALGGVPFYLDLVRPGESPSQAISRLCFGQGPLHGEFGILFKSLFEDGEHHEQMIRILGQKRRGMTRSQLLEALKVKSGGRVAERLQELEEAGFIAPVPVIEGSTVRTYYRVIDEFSLFHLRWIATAGKGPLGPAASQDYFLLQHQTPSFASWSGYAFETVCIKHLPQIYAALGITRVLVHATVWQNKVPKHDLQVQGAQIDLVLDRNDGMTTLVEIKYAAEPFAMKKADAINFLHKISAFKETMKSNKSVSMVLLAPYGAIDNEYARQMIVKTITAADLMDA